MVKQLSKQPIPDNGELEFEKLTLFSYEQHNKKMLYTLLNSEDNNTIEVNPKQLIRCRITGGNMQQLDICNPDDDPCDPITDYCYPDNCYPDGCNP